MQTPTFLVHDSPRAQALYVIVVAIDMNPLAFNAAKSTHANIILTYMYMYMYACTCYFLLKEEKEEENMRALCSRSLNPFK